MTDAVPLTFREAALIVLGPVKDQTYRATPTGTMVARYIRWLRNEYGATASTVRDYEAILARMALMLDDKQPADVLVDDLREVIDLWSMRQARTRQKVTSVIRAFWAWMEEQGHIAISPAARIRRPKAEQKVARVLPADARPRLLEQAKDPRDRLALHCLLGLGLRRAELAGLQIRDFDAQRGLVRVYGKGQKERTLPVRGVMLDELRLLLAGSPPGLERGWEPDDYLLFPQRRLMTGRGREGQATRRLQGDPKRPMSPVAVHRWWYRQAANAGLVAQGVTSGLNMHQARHLFAVEMRRASGLDAASHALGHSQLSTTLGIYGHRDDADLEAAMETYVRWLAAQDSAPSVSPEDEGEK